MKKKPKIKLVDEKDYTNHILALLIFVGVILRLYQIGFNSLWLDEISTYNYAKGTFTEIWRFMATGVDYSPPLYFFLQHFMIQIFGASETGLRLLSAIFGIATIPAMYLVGKEFRDRYSGLVAAGFITFSPFLITYSQEARSYAMTLFFVAITVLFYLKALRSDNVKDWILFGIFAAVSFWTHYYAVVFIAAMGLHRILLQIPKGIPNKEDLNPIVGLGAFVAIIFPLIITLVPVYAQRTASAPTYGIQGYGIVSESIVQIFGYSVTTAFLGLILFALGIFMVYSTKKDDGVTQNLELIVLMIGMTFLVSIIMSYRIPMLPRYLIFLTIPFSLGISEFFYVIRDIYSDKITPTRVIAVFMALFILMGLPFYFDHYTKYSKEPWREIAGDIREGTVDGDTIVAVPVYIQLPLGFYYDNINDHTFFNGTSDVEGLQAIKPEQNRSVYYVITGDIYAADPSGRSLDWLKQNTVSVANYGSVSITKRKQDV